MMDGSLPDLDAIREATSRVPVLHQGDDTYYASLDVLLMTVPEINFGYIYVGAGQFQAAVWMPDCGKRLVLADSGLTFFRGIRSSSANLPEYAYGFRSDFPEASVVQGSPVRRWYNPGSWFTKESDPRPPQPWIDEHPIALLKPRSDDLLLQTDALNPQYNRVKPLTQAGLAWVQARAETPESDFVLTRDDGTQEIVQPKDFRKVADAAAVDGLSVWVH